MPEVYTGRCDQCQFWECTWDGVSSPAFNNENEGRCNRHPPVVVGGLFGGTRWPHTMRWQNCGDGQPNA